MKHRNTTEAVAAIRARRRSIGLRSTETVLHEREIELLDALKARLSLSSRSDAMRLILAKTDINSFTSADAEALQTSAR